MPASNWLDRLRSTKGFPAADYSDLHHFLSFSPSNSDCTLPSPDRTLPAGTSTVNVDNPWFSVLCGLFNMGESDADASRLSKSCRKQAKPKFCDVSIPFAANDVECMRKDEYVSDKNSDVGANADPGEAVEEEEKSSSGSDKEELKGFCRSEVTIIDTSFDVWKSDKLVFRRKNIWKIKDKKAKSRTSGSKKRKANHLLDSSAFGNVAYKKKPKIVTPVNEGRKQQDSELVEVRKYSLDVNLQVPKKRIDICRSARKSKKNCTSALIRAISSTRECRDNPHLEEPQRE